MQYCMMSLLTIHVPLIPHPNPQECYHCKTIAHLIRPTCNQ
uniref:Uncharacterized protein n=1 Tax=Rhizophora mucronata TaxID=61149 RepID=A0A2P2J1V0_RHIMU